jgi:preprotein translocase subunit SecY
MGIFELSHSVRNFIPETEAAPRERRLKFVDKAANTVVAVFLFTVAGQIPLWGVN